MNGLEGFKLGCDPELFVINSDGVPVSAHGMIPGTKKEPYKVECGAVQVDGMALEFNIDPAETWQEFNGNIETVLKQLKGMLPNGHQFLIAPSVHFTQEVFDAQPPEALELGCDPDFNAWTNGAVNPAPEPAKGSTMRTAAGHIHIGFTEDQDISCPDHLANCCDLIKQLDWFLGFPALSKDKDGMERRALYGKAGCFRPKPYGVEYRTLSNFWIKNKNTRKWAWERTIEAIQAMATCEFAKKFGENHYDKLNKNIVSAINGDVESVKAISRSWGPYYPFDSGGRTSYVSHRLIKAEG